LYEHGALLVRADRRREGRPILREAVELASGCGARALATAATAQLRAGGGRRPRLRQAGVDALTPAERRVVQLAARELTNREIAQELFVTEKTVEAHLGRAYRKLGIRSRWQLASALAGSDAEGSRAPGA
jgi:DNA-binding CsgD family transcriptional regulator